MGLDFVQVGIATVVVSLVLKWVLPKRIQFVSREPLPGPLELPWVGSGWMFLLYDFGELMRSWTKQYGKCFCFTIFGTPYVVLSDPEAIRHVLGSPNFVRRWTNFDNAFDEIGAEKGVAFNNDLHSWKVHRRLFTDALSSVEFYHSIAQIAAANTRTLVHETIFQTIKQTSSHPVILNVVPMFKLFTLDIVTELALGTTFRKIGQEGSRERIRDIVVKNFEALAFFSIQPYKAWYQYIPILGSVIKRHLAAIKDGQHLQLEALQDAKAAVKDGLNSRANGKTSTYRDFAMELVREQTKREENATSQDKLSDNQIAADIFEMVLAGTDSSSIFLTLIFYHLAKYPAYLEKLREEIQDNIHVDAQEDAKAYYQSLRKLKLLTAFMKEIARVAPPSGYLMRGAVENDQIGQAVIPAKCNMVLNNVASGTDPAYIKDPLVFHPERYLDMKSKVSRLSFPFGYGGRACPGQYVAWTEIQSVLVEILPRVDVELNDPEQKLELVNHFVSEMKNYELLLKFRPHQSKKLN